MWSEGEDSNGHRQKYCLFGFLTHEALNAEDHPCALCVETTTLLQLKY